MALFGLVAFLIFPSLAHADIIIFKSGSAKVGIVEEENPAQVKFREKDKVATIMRPNIERIEYSTPEENEQLRLKWKEEKQRLEEQRKKRRQAEEKFTAEQKAKGLINMDGQWVSPAEAEARRQQQILQQVQSGEVEASMDEQAGAEEEVEEPEFLGDLDPEQRDLFMEDLKRQQKIKVAQVQIIAIEGVNAAVKGTVTNGSDSTAKNIEIEIECYDENGEMIDAESAVVSALKPGESGSFRTTLGVEAEFIKQTKARVINAQWE
jgi:hypothetical protein